MFLALPKILQYNKMSPNDSLGIVSLSMLTGLFLTIFYKRDFKFHAHLRCRMGHIVCLSLMWGLVYLTDQSAFEVVVAIGTLVYVLKEQRFSLASEEKVKCLALGISLMIAYFSESQTLTPLAIVFALTQLLRWPIDLKNRLRELRIVCGPVYTIFAVGSWLQSSPTSNLLRSAAFLSLVASIFLRPDNNEVLKVLNYFGSIPSSHSRKIIHGFCMFASFILCFLYFVNVVTTSTVNTCIFCILCFVAVVNIAMYIFVAEFPRFAVKWLKGTWNNYAFRLCSYITGNTNLCAILTTRVKTKT
ncbi:uncharacterized protein LOC114529333 [Dendronephthya gigantea]|uniref:uncharacterized protein LOC114529333 n=1 Tax=Dendronephthya gigantea TaxID=151771 RepID=UPI00106D3D59|nr:uncharacterized protein LOC114529333 [Dendronephthya gigantea]XP_028406895.1 uncharacterized protein LOC114529333 [Dendronephthya gigantea]XP_028406896.1 uncharacterized protein LOC114529333 [Dendronephthya gigantea]